MQASMCFAKNLLQWMLPGYAKFLKPLKKLKLKSYPLYLVSPFGMTTRNGLCLIESSRETSVKLYPCHLLEMVESYGTIRAKLHGPTWNIRCETGTIKTGYREITLWR